MIATTIAVDVGAVLGWAFGGAIVLIGLGMAIVKLEEFSDWMKKHVGERWFEWTVIIGLLLMMGMAAIYGGSK